MAYLLHQLLEESAIRFPDKIAVSFKNQSVSYQDLNVMANRIAHLLIENGVQRGDRVALYLGKSIFSIAAIFGILKTGGVYVPLDINAPEIRIEYIMKNCSNDYENTSYYPEYKPERYFLYFFHNNSPNVDILIIQQLEI